MPDTALQRYGSAECKALGWVYQTCAMPGAWPDHGQTWPRQFNPVKRRREDKT